MTSVNNTKIKASPKPLHLAGNFEKDFTKYIS